MADFVVKSSSRAWYNAISVETAFGAFSISLGGKFGVLFSTSAFKRRDLTVRVENRFVLDQVF